MKNILACVLASEFAVGISQDAVPNANDGLTFDANDGLHLLQMHAHAHSSTQPKPLDEIVVPENARRPLWELKKRPKFGPDGTWATPYCKSVLGCTPYCVDGCNGVAVWSVEKNPPGLGAEGREEYDPNNPGGHFVSCIPTDKSRGRAPTPDYKILTMGGMLQCSGSENSTKTPFWVKVKATIMTTARKDELGIHWGCNDDGACKDWNSGGYAGDGQGWGNEYCPKGCVNDCASFSSGGFASCGFTPNPGQSGAGMYSGAKSNAVGPNPHCPLNAVYGTGQSAYTWCGEAKKTCKLSKETKAEIQAARAAMRTARKAFKDAKEAFKDAKDAFKDAKAKGEAECEQ